MPRRASRQQLSSPVSQPIKRALSPPASTPRRQSKRAKATSVTPVQAKVTPRATPKQSKYFEKAHESSEEPESDIEDEVSGYEDEDLSASAVSSPPGSDMEDGIEEDDYNSEEEKPKRRASTKKVAISSRLNNVVNGGRKGQELWRPGVKADVEPGQEVFIKLPKAREAGKTPYKPSTIHPNTILFLSDLKKNNDREWLKVHDADYRQSKKDFDLFVESLTTKIIEEDETIPELPPKDLTFRIYRDIRFSPDPTPYKTHFSAAWSRTGRKGPYAAYYVQIQPGGSFVGGGLWHPEAAPLALLRRNIDRNAAKIKKVLIHARIRKEFFNGIPADEKKATKAFIGQNSENMLKTKPKGYDAEHPNIDLLRLRNFTMGRKLKDDEVVGPKGLPRILELIGALTPFITYLNDVVMPDGDGDSDDDTDGDNGSDGDDGHVNESE
ncbi:hypothetical protein MMC09_001069 [Bachmanniomyces sp. S44760]|nr:hypothetical protein [Bachmanniomyces sp. S44760]